MRATRESGVQEPVARKERASLGRSLGVDGDGAAAGALEQGGGGEAEGSAADDGDVLPGWLGAGEGLRRWRASPEPQERDQPEPPWP